MTDAESFLAAICAAPADDTVRLVYADWLEENGDEARAEFIRVQWELSATDEKHPANEGIVAALRRRERELWCNGSWAWFRLRNLRPVDTQQPCYLHWVENSDRDVIRTTVRRGFVAEVTCSADDWLAHADALHWHPGQTAGCPLCRSPVGTPPHPDCYRCKGTGRVPRPCPPTAQPVTRVVLTTRPSLPDTVYATPDCVCVCVAGENVVAGSDSPEDVWPLRWKGITFEMPPPTTWESMVAGVVGGASEHHSYP